VSLFYWYSKATIRRTRKTWFATGTGDKRGRSSTENRVPEPNKKAEKRDVLSADNGEKLKTIPKRRERNFDKCFVD